LFEVDKYNHRIVSISEIPTIHLNNGIKKNTTELIDTVDLIDRKRENMLSTKKFKNKNILTTQISKKKSLKPIKTQNNDSETIESPDDINTRIHRLEMITSKLCSSKFFKKSLVQHFMSNSKVTESTDLNSYYSPKSKSIHKNLSTKADVQS